LLRGGWKITAGMMASGGFSTEIRTLESAINESQWFLTCIFSRAFEFYVVWVFECRSALLYRGLHGVGADALEGRGVELGTGGFSAAGTDAL